MRLNRAYWISSFLVAATILVGLWGWVTLPEGAGVPLHHLGFDGQMHGEPSRAVIWAIPFAAFVVLATMRLVARRGVGEAVEAYEATIIGVAGVLLVAEAVLVARAQNPGFDVMRPVAVAVGVLLLALGNVLGKARHNAVFGVRTPWTLADPRVWDKTHRFAGRGLVLGGVALIAIALVLKQEAALGIAIAVCTAGPLLTAVGWSRRLSRRRH
ncbi:SdpI family protein [Phenylobacterium sp.]|uniref:SdpI family protein n=1 Tax=Phenylobacterium sp. TaxID=1871053 RepID=UPI0025EA8BE0|nr:SdpI family protein [Phenylobacterium sp.]